ncbi:hypothetical protein AMJ83_03495 [candidate division WOR_3 bacterium SM23_42]|uniref:Uncharacterized protein n=1 Tax=candidate division WOR_3 bacterium SM23_42 TaxID=1703779 RepID=A0A0S8FUB7_UNCW3|nr:MAG: hypothetical protein AMJ83_03495 [candidate division WOR_3 bacterium SM23_42]
MRFTGFARINLPPHEEKAFDDFLLGCAEAEQLSSGDSGEENRSGIGELESNAHDAYFRGFYLDGLKYYARSLASNREKVTAWVGEVRILVDVGRFDAAVYWANRGLESFGESRLLASSKAFALAYAGDTEAAKRLINVPVEKDETPVLWLLRGEVFLRIRINLLQKLFAPHKGIGSLGAFFCFLKALSSDPGDPFMNQRIGLAYLLANKTKRAFEHLKTSLNVVPDNPLTLYGFAECHRAQRDYERALYYVKKALAGNPHLDSAFGLLQWLHGPIRKILGGLHKKIRKG